MEDPIEKEVGIHWQALRIIHELFAAQETQVLELSGIRMPLYDALSIPKSNAEDLMEFYVALGWLKRVEEGEYSAEPLLATLVDDQAGGMSLIAQAFVGNGVLTSWPSEVAPSLDEPTIDPQATVRSSSQQPTQPSAAVQELNEDLNEGEESSLGEEQDEDHEQSGPEAFASQEDGVPESSDESLPLEEEETPDDKLTSDDPVNDTGSGDTPEELAEAPVANDQAGDDPAPSDNTGSGDTSKHPVEGDQIEQKVQVTSEAPANGLSEDEQGSNPSNESDEDEEINPAQGSNPPPSRLNIPRSSAAPDPDLPPAAKGGRRGIKKDPAPPTASSLKKPLSPSLPKTPKPEETHPPSDLEDEDPSTSDVADEPGISPLTARRPPGGKPEGGKPLGGPLRPRSEPEEAAPPPVTTGRRPIGRPISTPSSSTPQRAPNRTLPPGGAGSTPASGGNKLTNRRNQAAASKGGQPIGRLGSGSTGNNASDGGKGPSITINFMTFPDAANQALMKQVQQDLQTILDSGADSTEDIKQQLIDVLRKYGLGDDAIDIHEDE